MTELRRCPFCNSEVDFIKGEHAWFVKCPGCKEESYHFRSPNGKERLIEYWNSRPIETELINYIGERECEIDELKEKIDELNARTKELEAEIDKWKHYDPSENMQFVRKQALNSGSLAAQGVYIQALESENNKFKSRIKELERQVDEYHKFYWGNGRLNHP